MLELTYSNRTENLLAFLAGRVTAERAAAGGPWEPVHIVVPNPGVKEYLNQGLARRLGVAANIKYSYLDGLWEDLLVDDTRSLLAFDVLRAGVLCVLADGAFLARASMAPVRAYLASGNLDLKRVQLAAELGRMFEEYQLSRPDWVGKWRQGETLAELPKDGMQVWQAQVWREVLRLLDAPGPKGAGVAHVTLLELIGTSGFAGMRLPRAIHGFGLTHVAQAYQEVFRAFGPLEETTLHLYALNPCGEFWEDLDTDRRALWQARPKRATLRLGTGARDPEAAADEDPYQLASEGPMALRLWGRPGREKIRLLNEVTQCDFTSAFQVPAGDTLLARLQRDILLYRNPGGEGRTGLDGSVRCQACPTQRREAEAVATEIWRLLDRHERAGDPLGFSDFAVIVPPADQEAYTAHLQAAFHNAHGIPMVESDRVRPVLGQTLEAVDLLLALPTSGFTRAALLSVLEHPALRRRCRDLDADVWGRWCEQLGIVRGADREAWKDTYLAQDVLNWDQGLRRLALGAFMADDTEFETPDGTYRVNGGKDPATAAAFLAMVSGLCREAGAFTDAALDPRTWSARLGAFLQRWLQVDDGEEAEAVLKALKQIRDAFGRLYERVPAGLSLPVIDYPAARHLALEALERLKGAHPAGLAKGVVVSTYATMRAIPFRAVFLMGFGEGGFPAQGRRGALDLRVAARRAGDVSPSERDKYLFLEMLLSARDHLWLSFVAMDDLSGEAFEPSGLFKEFRTLLDGYLVPELASGQETDPVLETHPLHRFDEATCAPRPKDGTPQAICSSIAEKEGLAVFLGRQARAAGLPMPLCVGDAALDPAARLWLRQTLETAQAPPLAEVKGVLRVSLAELKTFLECPLTGAAAVRLGLRKRDLEDRAAVEDEAFDSDHLEAWALRNGVALEALKSGEAVDAVYARHLKRLQAGGGAPFGVFAKVEAEDNLPVISAWVTYLRQRHPGEQPATWRLGPARTGGAEVDVPLAPLVLDVPDGSRSRRVELTGDLRVQWHGSLFLERRKLPGPGDLNRLRRKALGAYLDHLVLTCVDPAHGAHVARFVFEEAKAGEQEHPIVFEAMDRDAAAGCLAALLQDLLDGDHGVLMPIEAVLDGWGKGALTAGSILDYVDGELEQEARSFLSTLNGPVPDPSRFPPPADPKALAEARLGPFLKQVFPPRKQEAV